MPFVSPLKWVAAQVRGFMTDDLVPPNNLGTGTYARRNILRGDSSWGSAADVTVSSAVSLELDIDVSNTYIYTGSLDAMWSLPLIAGNENADFSVTNRGTGILTIDTVNAGIDFIFTDQVEISVEIEQGESFNFLNDGTYWIER